MKTIDLRSDTVTKPTPKMQEAMFRAEVGDDVYGDDPSINMLEDYAAERFGFEAALFTPSGTAANLIALMSHCGRGDEYLVGQDAHTYRYEGGGAAILGSIQPQPIEFAKDGSLDLDRIEEEIKPDDFHYARTRLLCLENTQGGKVLPMEYLERARYFSLQKGLALHLDGARAFNAAVALDIDIKKITGLFDSASICLSKGLGAPVGSLLCGSVPLINQARRWRKVTGGAMRQAGSLAAAGLYALENHVERLSLDHDNAKRLQEGLKKYPTFCQISEDVQTNMVFVQFQESRRLAEFLKTKNILISEDKTTRLVTHLDISGEDIDYVIKQIGLFAGAL
ncbi:low-specificity L-threonine aldolase [Desulfotalea psychrophila]|nr:low-specificity L-threonine aldolase [Desulfotalea psychrophila]